MFSGIIKEICTVHDIKYKDEIVDLTISPHSHSSNIELGDSIAINGCCLTVTQINKDDITFQITKESLEKTNLSELKFGSKVNIEPALKMGSSLDGHLVSGHIDGTGTIKSITNDGENRLVEISHSPSFSKYIAAKGSICVNGVSLTVIDAKHDSFTFTLIPFTRDNTNLGLINIGDKVNLEIDLISRYLVNYIEKTKEKVIL